MKVFVILTSLLCSSFALAGPIESLSFLAGHWASDNPGAIYETSFTSPAGGVIVGAAKLVDAQSHQVSFFEFSEIRVDHGTLVLSPRPFGQAGVSFIAVEQSEGRVVFENSEHEFPRRITYALDSAGWLVTSVEGTQNGQRVEMHYRMRKH